MCPRWINPAIFQILLIFMSGCGHDIENTRGKSIHRVPVIQADQLPQKGSGAPTPITNTFTVNANQLTESDDIIFLVDTSLSMAEEKAALEASFSNFMKRLSDLGVSGFNVYAVGTGFNFSADVTTQPNFFTVDSRVSSSNALNLYLDLEDGQIPLTQPFHKNARRELIVVSDGNASMSADIFKSELALRNIPQVSVNGIIGLKAGRNSATCSISTIGSVYIALAEDATTHGMTQDLCASDWNFLLDNLASSLIEKMSRPAFTLSHDLAPNTKVEVLVNNQLVDIHDYTIDYDRNEILFASDHVPQDGDVIQINYLANIP